MFIHEFPLYFVPLCCEHLRLFTHWSLCSLRLFILLYAQFIFLFEDSYIAERWTEMKHEMIINDFSVAI